MNLSEIIRVFESIPSSMLPEGSNFDILQSTLELVLGGWTTANDTLINNLSLTGNPDKILDTWGIFLGIPRDFLDDSIHYLTKLKTALNSKFTTIDGIENFLEAIYQIQSSVTNNPLNQAGYSISLASNAPTATISQFLSNLVYVRPAGVPFAVNFLAGGVFTNGSTFLGANTGTITTAYSQSLYLGGSSGSIGINIPMNTNNAKPSNGPLPYFTDPVLTGQTSLASP